MLVDPPVGSGILVNALPGADLPALTDGFGFDELSFDTAGNLPLETDPKRVWVIRHPERFPIEINRAAREELLRVPGIGPKSARRILARRVKEKFRSVENLKGTGAVVTWAAPYILINGRRVSELREPGQMRLDLRL